MSKERGPLTITKIAAALTRLLVVRGATTTFEEVAKHRLRIHASIPFGEPDKKGS